MVNQALSSSPNLTSRQIEIVELLVQGYGKRQIAKQLNVEENIIDRILDAVSDTFRVIDPELGREELGILSKIARIVAIYVERYPGRISIGEEEENLRRLLGPSLPLPPLIRNVVRSELDISEDKIVNDTQVGILCLQDQLTHTAHGIIIDDRNKRANVLPQQLDVWSHSPSVKISHKIVVEDEKRPLFQVIFDPPLVRGQQLVYHYRTVISNYFPMSRKEISERMASGQYGIEEPFCEKSYSIGSPTSHLYLRLTFPPSFEITDEHVVVEVGRGGPRDPVEEVRVVNHFERTIFARRISICLDLDEPLLLRRYRIRWQPSI